MKNKITPITINKVTQALSKLRNKYPEVYSLLNEEPFGHEIRTTMEMNNDSLINYVVHNAENRAKHQHLNLKNQRTNSTFFLPTHRPTQKKTKELFPCQRSN